MEASGAPSVDNRIIVLILNQSVTYTDNGDYYNYSCITERMPGVTHCLQRYCIPPSTSLHSGRDSTL